MTTLARPEPTYVLKTKFTTLSRGIVSIDFIEIDTW